MASEKQATPLHLPSLKAAQQVQTDDDDNQEGFFDSSTPIVSSKKQAKSSSTRSKAQQPPPQRSNSNAPPTEFITASANASSSPVKGLSNLSKSRAVAALIEEQQIQQQQANEPATPSKQQLLYQQQNTGAISSSRSSYQTQQQPQHQPHILGEKDLIAFRQLEEKSANILLALDTKMFDSLQRKEYEIVKSFKAIITSLTNEVKSLNERIHKQDLFILRDTTIMALEKQLKFFREQTFDLSSRVNDLESQVRMLLTLNSDKDDQIASLMGSIRANKAHSLSNATAAAGAAGAPGDRSLRSISEIAPSSPKQLQLDSSQFSAVKANPYYPIAANSSGIYSKKALNWSSSSSQYQQPPTSATKVNESILSDLTAILSNPIVVNNQTNNNTDTTSIMASDTKQFIFDWVKSILNQKQIEIDSLKRQLKESKRGLSKYVRLQAEESELHALFVRAIAETKSAVLKRNGNNNYNNNPVALNGVQDRFLEADRIQIVLKFFASQKFMDIVQAKIFNEKCCDNFNCKFNLQASDHGPVPPVGGVIIPYNPMESSPLNHQHRPSQQHPLINEINNLIAHEDVSDFTLDSQQQQLLLQQSLQQQNYNHNPEFFNNSSQKSARSRVRQGLFSQSPNTQKTATVSATTMSAGKAGQQQYTSQTTRNRSMTSSNNQPSQQLQLMQQHSSGKHDSSSSGNAIPRSMYDNMGASLLCDANYIKERSKNQQEIYRINNQFRRLLKDEKIHDQDIDRRVTGFLNSAIHKLSFEQEFSATHNDEGGSMPLESSQQELENHRTSRNHSHNNNAQNHSTVLPKLLQSPLNNTSAAAAAAGIGGGGGGATLTPQASPNVKQQQTGSLRVAYKHGKIFQQ